MRFDIDKIKGVIKNTSPETGIYVGTDSVSARRAGKKQNGLWTVRYVTVIIVHYDSCRGGKVFFEVNHKATEDKPSLKARLLHEVNYSVTTALQLLDVVDDRIFEVHLDINPDPKCASAIAVKEAVGWVQAQGLEVRVKPEAFAATAVADTYTKKMPA